MNKVDGMKMGVKALDIKTRFGKITAYVSATSTDRKYKYCILVNGKYTETVDKKNLLKYINVNLDAILL